MLAENLKYLGEKERRKGRQAGLQERRMEGRMEALRGIITRQLTRRFGALPDWVTARLNKASAEHLEAWTDEMLVAESLDELFCSQG